MKQYTDEQTWYEEKEGEKKKKRFVVGLLQSAVDEIGPVVWVDLPKIGAILTPDTVAVVIESTKAAIDIYSPISGTVHARNEQLLSDAGIASLNQSAESSGWLYEIDV